TRRHGLSRDGRERAGSLLQRHQQPAWRFASKLSRVLPPARRPNVSRGPAPARLARRPRRRNPVRNAGARARRGRAVRTGRLAAGAAVTAREDVVLAVIRFAVAVAKRHGRAEVRRWAAEFLGSLIANGTLRLEVAR